MTSTRGLGLRCLVAIVLATSSTQLLDGEENSQTPPNTEPLNILYRMDLNRDGVLDLSEVPPGAEEFVIEVTAEAGTGLRASLELVELTAGWLKFAEKVDAQKAKERKTEYPLHETAIDNIPWGEVGRGALLTAAESASTGIDPELELLARLDRDHDGILRLDEVPANARVSIRALVKSAGFSPDRPVRLQELADRRRTDRKRGVADDTNAAVAISSTELRLHAARLLETYDENEDGLLEKDEWMRLSGSWGRADRNRDRYLSVSEVASHLKNLVQQAPRRSGR